MLPRNGKFRFKKPALFVLALALLAPLTSHAQGLTIQGRVAKSDGTPVTGAATKFRVQIYSPGSSPHCALYDETHILDLTNTGGLFSIDIGKVDPYTVVRNAPLTYSISQAVSNRVPLTVDGAYCSSGSPGTPETFTPAADDIRKVVIQFQDPASMSAFEGIPEMDLNPVAYALDSRSIGGFSAASVMRVVDTLGNPASVSSYTSAQFADLTTLIAGTSSKYLSTGGTGGVQLPTSTPATPAAGSIWYDAGTLKYSDGTTTRTVGTSSGGTGTISNVIADSPLNGGGGTATIHIGLDASGVAAQNWGDATKVPQITTDIYGRITAVTERPITGTLPAVVGDGQYLRSNATTWQSSTINSGDLKNAAGSGSLFPGAACSGSNVLNWNSVSGSFQCVAISGITSSQLATITPALSASYRTVTVSPQGIVTGGSNPTTLAGYSIGDAIQAVGTISKFRVDTASNRGAAASANAGTLFLASDSGAMAYDNGGTWIEVTSGGLGTLAGDVTGAPGSNTVTKIGSTTAAQVDSMRTQLSAATSLATSTGTLVARDGSGNFGGNVFSANKITLLGSTANTATIQSPSSYAATYSLTLPAAAPAAGQSLQSDASGVLSWVTAAAGTLTGIANGTGTQVTSSGSVATVSLTNTGVTAQSYGSATSVPQIAVDAQGRITSASSVTITGTVPGGAAGGDLSGTYPNPAVNKILGQALSGTFGANGQVLRYNGTGLTPGFVSMGDLRSQYTGANALPASCAANQTLTWNSASDNLTCSSIAIGNSNIADLDATKLTGTIDVARLPGSAKFWDSATGGINFAGGRVGIGTSTPGSALEVAGSGQIRLSGLTPRLTLTPAASGTSNLWNIDNNGGKLRFFREDYAASGTGASGADRMTILDSGNVGIGTSSPANALDINGGIGLLPTATSPNTGIYSPAANDVRISTNGFSRLRVQTGGAVQISSNGLFIGAIGTPNLSMLDIAGGIALGAGYAGVTAAPSNGAIIQGNVGLGITAPTAALHLKAGSAAAGTAPLKFTTGPLLSTEEKGAVEYDGTNLYYTDDSNVRHVLASSAGGATNFNNPVTMSGAGTGLTVTNNASVGGNLSIGGTTTLTGATSITNTTNSSSTGTGALTVAGGLGVAATINSAKIAVADGNAANPSITFTSAPTNGFFYGTSNSIGVATNGTEKMRLLSNGNLGIGTNNPSMSLEIQGGSSTIGTNGIKILSTNDTGSNNAYLEAIAKRSDGNGSGTFAGTIALAKNRTDAAHATNSQLGRIMFGGNHTDGTLANVLYSSSIAGITEGAFSNATTMPTGLAFYTGSTGYTTSQAASNVGTEKMRITNAGAVGIGTSAPLGKLEVASGALNVNTNGSVAPSLGTTAFMQVNEGAGVAYSSLRSTNDAFGSNFVFQKTRSANGAGVASVANSDVLGTISFASTDGTGWLSSAAIKAAVNGTVATGSVPADLIFSTGTSGNGSERMRILSSGGVGIGTAGPIGMLNVNCANGADCISMTNSAGKRWTQYFTTNGSDTDYRIWEGQTTTGNRFTIQAGGNVGLGTTSPNTTLDMVGAFSMRASAAPSLSPATQGRIYFDSSSNQFMVSQNGGAYSALATTGGAGQNFTSPVTMSGSGTGLTVTNNASVGGNLSITGSTSISSAVSSTSTTTGALTIAGGLGVGGSVNANRFMAADGLVGSPSHSFTSAPSTGFWYPGSNGIALSANGVEAMRVLASGNVGIGTTVPGAGLDVVSSSGVRFGVSSIGDSAYFGPSSTIIKGGGATGGIYFQPTNGTNAVTMLSNGNMGIGTTVPAGPLHISSGANTLSFLDAFTGSAAEGSALIYRQARGTSAAPTALQLGDRLNFIGARGYGATGYSPASLSAISVFAAENFTDSAMGTHMVFETSPVSTTGRTERMRITSQGLVGISTNDPAAMLHVNGTALVGSSASGGTNVSLNSGAPALTKGISIYYQNGSPSSSANDYGVIAAGYGGSYNTQLALNPSGGNVGIGTSKPGSYLSLGNRTSGKTSHLRLYENSTDVYGFGITSAQLNYVSGGGSHVFHTGGAGSEVERMRITQSGLVGIGSSSPKETLDVAGGHIFHTGGALVHAFNAYYDGTAPSTWRSNGYTGGAGFSGSLGFNPGNGDMNLNTSAASNSAGTGFTYVPRISIKGGSGFVGIGTDNPSALLEVKTGGNRGITFKDGTNTDATIAFSSTTTGQYGRITSTGPLGFYPNGGDSSSSAPAGLVISDYNLTILGCLSYGGGTLGTCSSDLRLKKDITPYKSDLSHLLGLRPVTYRYNGLGGMIEDKEAKRVGLIAQEVEKVAPELVSNRDVKLHPEDNKKTVTKAVDYGALTFMLINGLKEFYDKWLVDHQHLADLEKKSAEKDQKIKDLEKRLETIERSLASQPAKAKK